MSARTLDLVGMQEIADRARDMAAYPNATRATVKSWRKRHADFPEPLVTLATGPVWEWDKVADWVRAHDPSPGRPRKPVAAKQ